MSTNCRSGRKKFIERLLLQLLSLSHFCYLYLTPSFRFSLSILLLFSSETHLFSYYYFFPNNCLFFYLSFPFHFSLCCFLLLSTPLSPVSRFSYSPYLILTHILMSLFPFSPYRLSLFLCSSNFFSRVLSSSLSNYLHILNYS